MSATPDKIEQDDVAADASGRPPLVAGERPDDVAAEDSPPFWATAIKVAQQKYAEKIQPNLARVFVPIKDRAVNIWQKIGLADKIRPIWHKTGLHRLPWGWILYIAPILMLAITGMLVSTGLFLLLMTEPPPKVNQGPQIQDVAVLNRASTDEIATSMGFDPKNPQTFTPSTLDPTPAVLPDIPAAPKVPHPKDTGISDAPDAKVALIPEQVALIEQTERGYLPRIGDDGSKPWKVYRRPWPAQGATAKNAPKIALIMTELGLSERRTEAAIKAMPGVVSLAFLPYVRDVQPMIDRARDRGHEILLNVPMEPLGYPRDDPGPDLLLGRGEVPDNIDRLHQSLGGARAYVGIISFMGSAIAANEDAMKPVVQELARRGVALVDNGSSARSVIGDLAEEARLPTIRVDRMIDILPQRQAIDDQLAALEKLARLNGQAVAIFQPLPVSIERVASWIPQLASRGIAIVPLSALLSTPTKQSEQP